MRGREPFIIRAKRKKMRRQLGRAENILKLEENIFVQGLENRLTKEKQMRSKGVLRVVYYSVKLLFEVFLLHYYYIPNNFMYNN